MLRDSLHILIIDDNPEILEVVSLMLAKQSYRVHGRLRVDDVVQEANHLLPDLIIIDHHLGWANGCDMCAKLKADQNLQHIPVIMFSAYHKTKEQCLLCGADAFLAKPFDMYELLRTVHTLTTRGFISPVAP